MRRFGIALAIVVISLLNAVAAATPPTPNFPLPKLKKGMWAITQDQEIHGQQLRHFPEKIPAFCLDPMATLLRDFESNERQGCKTELVSKTESEIVFATTCPPRPGGSEHIRLVIESKSSEQFRVTNSSELGRNVMAGRWKRECPETEVEENYKRRGH